LQDDDAQPEKSEKELLFIHSNKRNTNILYAELPWEINEVRNENYKNSSA